MKSTMEVSPKYVLIESAPLKRKTPGGILLPNQQEMEHKKGKVIVVGNKVDWIKKGDEVLFDTFKGEILIKDTNYFIVFNEDILIKTKGG